MFIPTFCPEDHGGLLSQEEALYHLGKMESHHANIVAEKQASLTSHDSIVSFHYSSGAQQALAWAADLMRRTIIEPDSGRKHMESFALILEQFSSQLRRAAESPLEFDDDSCLRPHPLK